MREFSKYVGLDTHKDTIAVAVCDALGGKPRYFGEIANTPEAVRKMVKDLCPDGEILKFCYEAGPWVINGVIININEYQWGPINVSMGSASIYQWGQLRLIFDL